jgi:hypothetical protein
MTQQITGRRSLAMGVCGSVAALLACLAASPALASPSPVDTSRCSAPQVAQPFLPLGDSNWYTLAPGQSVDNFAGDGWTLSGGASLQTAQLADGATGSVLDLPSGSHAVSPPMCVSTDYPTARAMARDVIGSEGIEVYVAYAGTKTQGKPKSVGRVHGNPSAWNAADPFKINPGKARGWQLVQFTLVPGGASSDFQVYNFYVDPRMKA